MGRIWNFSAGPAALPEEVLLQAQAELLDSQQLWPPPTFSTICDWSGWVRLTMVLASAYARFTSSLRAKRGAWPVTLWQPPQRLFALMLSHRLMRNDCTSAVEGAGPV